MSTIQKKAMKFAKSVIDSQLGKEIAHRAAMKAVMMFYTIVFAGATSVDVVITSADVLDFCRKFNDSVPAELEAALFLALKTETFEKSIRGLVKAGLDYDFRVSPPECLTKKEFIKFEVKETADKIVITFPTAVLQRLTLKPTGQKTMMNALSRPVDMLQKWWADAYTASAAIIAAMPCEKDWSEHPQCAAYAAGFQQGAGAGYQLGFQYGLGQGRAWGQMEATCAAAMAVQQLTMSVPAASAEQKPVSHEAVPVMAPGFKLAATETAAKASAKAAKACSFFKTAAGCRNGDQCRFSHEVGSSVLVKRV